MKYELTVLCPGIRTKNWRRLYDSIGKAFSRSWEIIFIGPYALPEEMLGLDNVKFIQDWGSPIRCQQRGLQEAQGVFVTWAADDGVFLIDSLEIARNKLMNTSAKTLVMGKYQEGPRLNDGMEKDWYYILSNHDSMKIKGVPVGCYMLNVGLVPLYLLLQVGGWDAQNFEVCPMAYNDLAVRLHNYGVEFIIQDEMMFSCSHLPGHEGDHGPIHDAQVDHDEPLFRSIYSRRDSENRIFLESSNWMKSPERWERRFCEK